MPSTSDQPGLPRHAPGTDGHVPEAAPKAKRPALVWYVLALVVPIAVSLVIAGGVVSRGSPKAGPAPAELGGLKLLRVQAGDQAMSAVAGMHSGTFELAEAWIASYEADATVWAGQAEDESKARQLVRAMAAAIGRGGSPFSPPRETQLAGMPVYATSDGGQQHYFYASGRLVVWIAAPASGGTVFVQEATSALR